MGLTLAPALLTKAVAGQGLERASVVNVLDYKLFNLNADYFSYTLCKAALNPPDILATQKKSREWSQYDSK